MTSESHGVGAAVGLVMIFSISLTACASSGPEADNPRELVLQVAQQARDAGAEEQYQAMKDGEVSADDYDNAFWNFSECATTAGLVVSAPVVNPIDGIGYLFEVGRGGLAEDQALSVSDECYQRYWIPISAAYVTVGAARMDEPLRLATMSCLRQAALDVTGDELNLRDFAASVDADNNESQRQALIDCVSVAAGDLYPELKTLNLVF